MSRNGVAKGIPDHNITGTRKDGAHMVRRGAHAAKFHHNSEEDGAEDGAQKCARNKTLHHTLASTSAKPQTSAPTSVTTPDIGLHVMLSDVMLMQSTIHCNTCMQKKPTCSLQNQKMHVHMLVMLHMTIPNDKFTSQSPMTTHRHLQFFKMFPKQRALFLQWPQFPPMQKLQQTKCT